ncbi:MAG: FAD:protein FMN transferase [Bacillota bacterium]|nr:FAD:protein FMN transferase [Bacillota bacterium]
MQHEYIERSFFSLGTVNYIKLYNCKDQSLLDLAQKRVMDIDDMMSAYKADSDISKLNSNSGRGFIDIHEDTYKLLSRSIEFSTMTSGAFDITIRPLVTLWGIGKKKNFIPSENEVSVCKKLVNYKNIILDHSNCRAALENPGQAVDLGGIAKGFAADEVKRILVENEIDSALINLGGNILTIGNKPDGTLWQIGIQNPLAATGQHLGIVSLSEKTIVTSGSNERFFIKDGVRYHHILDPLSGKPADNCLLSVTAIASGSMDADAITTSLFILGFEAIALNELKQIVNNEINYIERSNTSVFGNLGFEAIFITKNLEIIATSGLKEKLRIL